MLQGRTEWVADIPFVEVKDIPPWEEGQGSVSLQKSAVQGRGRDGRDHPYQVRAGVCLADTLGNYGNNNERLLV